MSSAWSQLDQLLTCAICLDRYRNPKLLPCQHTFCMEPCLEGLIDYGRRQIKCPECRAEHRIPYQGVQAFPTNVTLVRFLELHRDITGEEPEPPPSMMERCNVCSEKANLERCAHCEKKICTDCKEAHIDILRREINRINNQVRRGLHRLSDALSQTKKNAEKLQLNCTQVRDEIDDIVKRYSKDLKHTEERLKHDLEIYTQTELKSMTKLKEDLDTEVSNLTSNCELIDKYVKDNTEWTDVELLEYKEIFLKTLDFLRSFDTDNSDFTRRIKFQPRADPDVLHRNIADFGELKINAPVAPISQQSLGPPPSNALMRSQSDHRLAAQFARRQDNRSFADINQRLGGHTSDTEREGRPTSPLFSRSRRDTDSSYRRYGDRSRDYDYQDREYGRSRYNREENSTSGLSSSRWRENEDYGHRSRYGRDSEDYESETQHTRTVRFADDTLQGQNHRERILDIGDATKGPLSGVVRLMDSSKIMERLHQNEARQKQKEKQAQEQPPAQPPAPASVPAVPQPPPRRPPSRQQSEDDIDRQKKANKQQAATSTATTPAGTAPAQQTPEVPSRQTSRRQTTAPKEEDPKPGIAPERVQRVDSQSTETDENTASPRVDTVSERSPEPPSRFRKQPSVTERVTENGEQERPLSSTITSQSTNETSRSTSRCPRPTLGKATSLGGVGVTKPPLDKKTSLPVTRKAEDNDSEDDEEEEESALQAPRATQSSFFSRFRSNQQAPQRRLPDPEPRLLQTQDDESEEDDDEDDDDDEEEDEDEDNDQKQDVKITPKKTTEGSEESESETSSSSSSSSSSESESSSSSEEDDDEEEQAAKTVEENSKLPNMQRRRSSEDSVNSKSSSTSTATSNCDSRGKKCGSEIAKRKDNAKAIYEDNEEDENESEGEVISDAVESTAVKSTAVSERKRPVFSDVPTPQHYVSSSQRSDDTDTTDSSSTSSTKYHSLSRNTTPIVSNGTTGRNDDSGSSEGSSNGSSGSSNTSSGSSNRSSGGSCRRPPLARSRSSHEIGLGIDIGNDLEDEEEEEQPVTPSYRSRADRMSEGNNCFTRTRSRPQDENTAAALSSSSNNSWAKYLRSKYGSNATGRVVPRSRSSHSLYQRSDSDTSDDEGTSGRDSVISPGSYGFTNPRSTYMQKKRMLFKIGSRGTEPGNFTWPRGIAVGPENNIVVADSSNHRVQVFDAIGKFLHEFGTYGSAEGEFDCLAGVAVNRIGQYIVSDRYNQRIQLFDPSGRFLRAFGCEGRTDGRFNYPWGITTDSLGFIYVCDKENHRIQVFQSDGTFVGKFGTIGSRPGQLEHPHYIAVSNTNRVIVSDNNNHRIQIFDVNGRSLSTFGSEGSAEGQFKFPRGVAVDDQGYIIVGDSGNNRVQIFHPDGTFLRAFGTWGGGDGEFKGIEGVAVTSGGSILVCDRENHRIQVF